MGWQPTLIASSCSSKHWRTFNAWSVVWQLRYSRKASSTHVASAAPLSMQAFTAEAVSVDSPEHASANAASAAADGELVGAAAFPIEHATRSNGRTASHRGRS